MNNYAILYIEFDRNEDWNGLMDYLDTHDDLYCEVQEAGTFVHDIHIVRRYIITTNRTGDVKVMAASERQAVEKVLDRPEEIAISDHRELYRVHCACVDRIGTIREVRE